MSDDTVIDAGSAPRWKMPKWGWAIFGISMALNLLIVGSIIGMRWAGHHHGPGWHGGGMRSVIRDLPDKQRTLIRKGLKEVRADNRAAMDVVREKRRDLFSYARGTTLDASELERRIEEIQSLRNGRRERVQVRMRKLIAEIANDLDPEMRQRAIRQVIGGRRGKHGRKWRRRHRE